MSGICGWIGGFLQNHHCAIEAMVEGLPVRAAGLSKNISAPAAALAVRAHEREGAWFARGSTSAVIEGYPRWRDGRLARRARDFGHAAALLDAFRELGIGLLDRLGGAFSLAVVDRDSGCALLAIDRFGIRPLTYSLSRPGTLVFGSTTDAVRAFPGMTATVLPQTLYTYLTFVDRIPAPATVYEEQRKLLPGQFLYFDNGRAKINQYWCMPYEEDGEHDLGRFSEAVMRHMQDAVAKCVDDEDTGRVATFLSGGLDSSTVAGLLQRVSDVPVKTVTIGFDADGFDETPYAEIAARHFSTEYLVYYTTPADVMAAFVPIAELYDEPFANSSAIPAYFAALKACEAGAELILAGDGGDELFGGNSRYVTDAIFDQYQRLPKSIRRALIEPVLGALPPFLCRSILRRAANYVRFANMTPAERMIKDNAFRNIAAESVLTADALAAIDRAAPRAFANAVFESCPSSAKIHRMFQFDMRVTLADSDLRKVGYTCEMAGLRVKYPFLDDDVAEFSAGISAELLMRDGVLRYAYKKAMEGFLPNETLAKKKQGFGLPYLEFVRTYKPLNDLLCDILSNLKDQTPFRQAFVDELINQTRAGDTKNNNGMAWDLAAFEVWMQSRSISI